MIIYEQHTTPPSANTAHDHETESQSGRQQQRSRVSSEIDVGIYKRLRDKRLADKERKMAEPANTQQSLRQSIDSQDTLTPSHDSSFIRGSTAVHFTGEELGPRCQTTALGSPSSVQSEAHPLCSYYTVGQHREGNNKSVRAFPPPPSLRLLHSTSLSTPLTSPTKTCYSGSKSHPLYLLSSTPTDPLIIDAPSQQRLHPLLSLPIDGGLSLGSICDNEVTMFIRAPQSSAVPPRRSSLPEGCCYRRSPGTDFGPHSCSTQSLSHGGGSSRKAAFSAPLPRKIEHGQPVFTDFSMSALSADHDRRSQDPDTENAASRYKGHQMQPSPPPHAIQSVSSTAVGRHHPQNQVSTSSLFLPGHQGPTKTSPFDAFACSYGRCVV